MLRKLVISTSSRLHVLIRFSIECLTICVNSSIKYLNDYQTFSIISVPYFLHFSNFFLKILSLFHTVHMTHVFLHFIFL